MNQFQTSFEPVSKPENQTQTGFFAIKTPIEYTGRELIFTEFQLSQNGTSSMSTQEYLDQFLRIHLTSFKLNNKIISLHISKKHSSRQPPDMISGYLITSGHLGSNFSVIMRIIFCTQTILHHYKKIIILLSTIQPISTKQTII